MKKINFLKDDRAINIIQSIVLDWYKNNKRALPWRKNPSLYKTIVSEFMLQQTKIKTALPYFKRFIEKFPNLKNLANADETEVLKYWEGLGYYNRAINLHKVAKYLHEVKKKPKTLEEWKSLPGIGDYTAAAISSINQGQPNAVVDGNVVRVLARLTNNKSRFKNNTEAVKAIRPFANKIIDKKFPGEFNQAIMDLGSTICKKNKPICNVCPLNNHCIGFSLNSKIISELPRITRTPKTKIILNRALIFRNNTILLYKIGSNEKRLKNHYEVPLLEFINNSLSNKNLELVKSGNRYISNQCIHENFFKLKHSDITPINNKGDKTLYWIDLKEIKSIQLSGPHRRWINQLIEYKK